MKTKEQILRWLDKQPWKCEFYEEFFKDDNRQLCWNDGLIQNAFNWHNLAHRELTWTPRNKEYIDWYNSTDRPMSWEEYCEQNPIEENEYVIDTNNGVFPLHMKITRSPISDVTVMSKNLCEAFVAYMKLIRLRNAWVKDENLDELQATFKILYQDNKLSIFRVNSSTGLSFSDALDAADFFNTFIDLLEVAKPLL